MAKKRRGRGEKGGERGRRPRREADGGERGRSPRRRGEKGGEMGGREGRGEEREGGGGREEEGKESQEQTPNSHYSLDYLTSDGGLYSCCGESSDQCGSLTLLQRTILLHRQTENCSYSKAL